MTKKIQLVLVFAAAMLLTSSVFAAVPCSSGATLQFVGVGSSAQFNTLAYATSDVISVSGLGPANVFSVTGKDSLGNNTVQILDSRPGVNKTDSATTWIIWDSAANCNVYTYWSVDSTVGVKDFMAFNKITVGTASFSVQAAYGQVSPDVETADFSGTECGGATKCTTNKVGGLPDTATSVPSTVVVALSVIPANIPPAAKPKYCGVNPSKAGSGQYCYFNAAGTDIRPEDAYIATTRALTTIPTNGHLTGLGYNDAACGGDGLATGSKIGCPFYDSFGGSKVFNTLLFKMSGTDPIGGGAIPSVTSFDVGAAPVVVFVGNGDTTAGKGFGATVNGHYTFTNIDRQILAQVFQGRTHCTTDLLTTAPTVGKPIQVVQREALSGTYNTFEYTGVRTLGGSAPTAVGNPTATGATSNEYSGQEQGIDPALNFNTGAGCPGSGASAPNGSESCGNPLWLETKSGGCGAGLRLRAIGTGQEVPAALGKSNSGASVVTDGIGYSFWSYGNFSPAASGAGHYLTVDGIDPFFAAAGSTTNPNGAYSLPQCNFSALPCFAIPFTHVADGSYPLWNVLRIMSFANVGTGASATLVTPSAVLNLIAYDEIEVTDKARNTSDFVPYLKNLKNGGTLAAPAWTGDLNLFVFRSHYAAPGGPSQPDNGHHSCVSGGVAKFTGVALQGGSPGLATCLIDKGNDLGGSVLTVQSDVDWFLDAGTPIEEYNLHQ
jgi:hypothetical protein